DALARKVIKLSGLEVVDETGNGDIEIQYTGLRPGEKLYEELLIGDNVDGTEHPRIMSAHETFIPYDELCDSLALIEKHLNAYEYDPVLKRIGELVSGFNHPSGVVDYLA
ncbi:MAG: polysaccharide biosynthesis protein, partial [Thiotrichales bacterium]|nr:polysaccharide biosynthesis protein [Thiotrichales bacterium]